LFSQFTVHIQSLGIWVMTQRCLCKKRDAGKRCDGMNADRIKLLEDIGYVWALRVPVNVGWDAMYEQLKDFKKLNGHTNVPQKNSDNKVSVLIL
jgi:Helicase associated domain